MERILKKKEEELEVNFENRIEEERNKTLALKEEVTDLKSCLTEKEQAVHNLQMKNGDIMQELEMQSQVP